jgi:hypothetical protein
VRVVVVVVMTGWTVVRTVLLLDTGLVVVVVEVVTVDSVDTAGLLL